MNTKKVHSTYYQQKYIYQVWIMVEMVAFFVVFYPILWQVSYLIKIKIIQTATSCER